jgi:hypothetical protein
MRLFAPLLIAGLLSGCPSAKTPTPSEADEKSGTAKEDLRTEHATPPVIQPVEIEPPVVPSTSSTAGDAPAWFDLAKIEHAKVVQPLNQGRVGDRTATAMLLELQPGTTAQDCISNLRTEMAKTVPDVGEAVPGDKGRMTLQGTTDRYSYTIVCGPGKDGQTTLYLSYMDL